MLAVTNEVSFLSNCHRGQEARDFSSTTNRMILHYFHRKQEENRTKNPA